MTDNISFHGTSKDHAQTIIGPPSRLDINVGKGELGKGFYTGSSIAIAAIWAQSRFQEKGVVIEFDIPKGRFVQLKGQVMKTQKEVVDNWHTLKADGEVTSYDSGHDYIVAPFATIGHVGYQFKFESQKAQDELNFCDKTLYPCVS